LFYRPTKVARMWDTWLYYHRGLHYLYYLHETTGAQFDGMSVATSSDGVHFSEIGSIIEKREDAEWLGTGSVWEAGGQFVLNFSEQRNGVQAVFFAVSKDLLQWERLGDEYRCDADPRWYDNTPAGRWDCIWAVRRPDGGFWGYLTARPWSHTPGIEYESVGKVESDDGLHWRAAEPPRIEWGNWPKMDVGEVGAIEKIGGRHYMMLGYSEDGLGNRHRGTGVGGRTGMYTFVGNSPEGPFCADTEAYRLLGSNSANRMMTYFSRFYPTPDGMLVNHHAISRSDMRWMAPLKRALVDEAGHLSLGYWEGNDAAKGREIPLNLVACSTVQPPRTDPGWRNTADGLEIDQAHGGGLALLPGRFDLERGLFLEGDLQVWAPAGRSSGIGLYIEENARDNRGTALLAQTSGRTEIGALQHGRRFIPDDVLPLGISSGQRSHFRLLVRRSLLEFYLRDRLVQCYSLPESCSGRVGLVFEAGRAAFSNLRAWEMNL
jgi:hypothetical protein